MANRLSAALNWVRFGVEPGHWTPEYTESGGPDPQCLSAPTRLAGGASSCWFTLQNRQVEESHPHVLPCRPRFRDELPATQRNLPSTASGICTHTVRALNALSPAVGLPRHEYDRPGTRTQTGQALDLLPLRWARRPCGSGGSCTPDVYPEGPALQASVTHLTVSVTSMWYLRLDSNQHLCLF